MASDLFAKLSLGKWIALAVVLAVIGFVVLTQLTSFQIPETLIGNKQEPQVDGGINAAGSTATRNNLDEVNDIINKKRAPAEGQNTVEEAQDGN